MALREIIFRGKRIDNGDWVYGDYASSGCGIVCMEYLNEHGDAGEVFHPVDLKTIGQFTGLTTNGKKIFEGDIGRYKQTDGAKLSGKPITCIGKVVYNTKTASFAVDSKDELGVKNYDYFPIKDLEVIGNIHDNPELVEG